MLAHPRHLISSRQRLLSLTLVAGALLVTPLLVALPAEATPASPSCTTPAAADGHEPPCNPYLADSPWAGNHRGSYAQASSPFAGPVGPATAVGVRHLSVSAVPVIVSFSPPYDDGKSVLWASTVGSPVKW